MDVERLLCDRNDDDDDDEMHTEWWCYAHDQLLNILTKADE